VLKLSGHDILWRVRAGDYRVIYEIHDDHRVVIVLIVAHRRESYRGL
jgi:mRNA interferase RelE/StbE